MGTVALFVVLAFALVALPPFIATLCFDHLRREAVPVAVGVRPTRFRRRFKPMRLGKRM
jgi:hypothetical protein